MDRWRACVKEDVSRIDKKWLSKATSTESAYLKDKEQFLKQTQKHKEVTQKPKDDAREEPAAVLHHRQRYPPQTTAETVLSSTDNTPKERTPSNNNNNNNNNNNIYNNNRKSSNNNHTNNNNNNENCRNALHVPETNKEINVRRPSRNLAWHPVLEKKDSRKMMRERESQREHCVKVSSDTTDKSPSKVRITPGKVSGRSPKTSSGVGFETTTFGLLLQRSINRAIQPYFYHFWWVGFFLSVGVHELRTLLQLRLASPLPLQSKFSATHLAWRNSHL